MTERNHLFKIRLNGPFNKTIKRCQKALREAGFEVISEINFSDLIEDRLGIKVKKYLILEILNPFMAYQSLLTSLEAGLFVPFRIAAFEDRDGNINILLLNPEETTRLAENMVFKLIAGESWEKLRNTMASLNQSHLTPVAQKV